MSEIDTLQELEALKAEMAVLKQNLNKEQIINKDLLRTVMRQNSSWINKFIKFETIILIPTYLLFVLICYSFQVSQWYAFVFLVLAGIDNLVDYHTYRIPAKLFSTCTMVEIRNRLIRQKKERFIQLCISLPACFIFLGALGYEVAQINKSEVSNWLVNAGGLAGGIVGGILGVTIALIVHFKAQRTNDLLLGEIHDE